jgi:predicted dienelactone hydrolase
MISSFFSVLRAPRRAVRHVHHAMAASLLALAALSGAASAQHAGLRTFVVPGDEPVHVALFYPTAHSAAAAQLGPWRAAVAPGSPISAGPLKGLILVSHGTGGSELGHHNLATRLAAEGYLVAALRHPGDNWQDRSMITSGRYFGERPRQVSRVLDALLASPEWGARIPAGRIGALGHSAGGYTVLALAGAQAEPARAAQHCRSRQDDPGFYALAQGPRVALPEGAATRAATPDGAQVSAADPRIRAVVALAPMAVVLTPESLKAVTVPVLLRMAELDAVLATKYHGGHVAAHLPAVQAATVAGAGHFAFMAQPGHSLPSDAGDAAANPAGFDRVGYHGELESQVVQFFAQQWTP